MFRRHSASSTIVFTVMILIDLSSLVVGPGRGRLPEGWEDQYIRDGSLF